jgi:nucleotide-binding universal stress UspA family protein
MAGFKISRSGCEETQMYRRVLLAYDGSLEGRIALREGALLAKQWGAKVFLLAVAPDSAGMHLAEGVCPGGTAGQQERYGAVLEGGVARLKAIGLDPVARFVKGQPVHEIQAFAREVDADLIVVGHQPQKFLDRWWSGSADVYLVDNTHCSVLVARNSVSDQAFEAELQRFGQTPDLEGAAP